MPPRFHLASLIGSSSGLALALVGAGVRAEDAGAGSNVPVVAPALRLDLRGGAGWRDDRASMGGTQVIARGTTGSTLSARAAWFGSRAHLGVAAHASWEWFTLREGDVPEVPMTPFSASAGQAGAAIAVRAPHRARAGVGRIGDIDFELQAGWDWLQLPVVSAETAATGVVLRGDRLRTHGPTLAAAVAAPMTRWAALEVTADVMPVAFAAAPAGIAVRPRRWEVAAAVAIGPLAGAGADWSILIGYGRGRTSAGGDGIDIQQDHQHLGLGLRASWLPGVPRSIAAQATPEPARARLRLVVHERTDSGRAPSPPLPGIAISVASGGSIMAFVTDAHGELTLQGLPAGPAQVQLSGPGWQPSTEIVSVPARGEVSADLFISRARTAAAATSAITGLVRSESGTPVTAQVRIVELGVVRTTDARGAFHFDLPAGSYTMIIEAAGFVGQRKQITAGADEQQIYNVDLATERR
jgi:hypothetical protein